MFYCHVVVVVLLLLCVGGGGGCGRGGGGNNHKSAGFSHRIVVLRQCNTRTMLHVLKLQLSPAAAAAEPVNSISPFPHTIIRVPLRRRTY